MSVASTEPAAGAPEQQHRKTRLPTGHVRTIASLSVMMSRSVPTAVVALLLAATGCGGGSSEAEVGEPAGAEPSSAELSSAELPGAAVVAEPVRLVDVAGGLELLADPEVTVIDVRTPDEFAAGHIERARLVDFSAPDFSDRIAELDRSATYFVYCRSGNRSAQAAAVMAELGFTDVSHLDGGIVAWTAAGAPVQP